MNMKVLSFFKGKPIAPPNCWRLSEFFTGWPLAVSGKRLAWSQCLGQGKGIACIQNVVAEKAVSRPMELVGAGLGHDI